MLWACLRLPGFSLQLRLRGAKSSGAVIVTSGGNRPRVLSCNPPARSHGIRPGMAASAAVALAPDLVEHVRDSAAEAQALRNIAAWAGQFTSIVCLVPPDAVLLEIAGSLRLFGGLRPLLLSIDAGLVELGYTAALTAAPTPTGACLLARAGTGARITDPVRLPAALAPLPLVLLDQPEETVHTLAVMGVHTIGECLALPREGLARRFGQQLLDELDRALGRLPDAREPYIHPMRYVSKLALPAPVREIEPLLFAAKRLLLELAGFLRMRQTGVTRLELTLQHEDRKPTVVMLGFAVPCRDAERMLRLLRERLTNVELPDRVEVIALESKETRPLDSRNLSLFPEDRLLEEQRWLIIEHLRARLGTDAVHGIVSHPDHRPEQAWRACEPGTDAASSARSTRPVWLLEAPFRLPVVKEEARTDALLTLILSHIGRGEPGPLTVLAGPERIESGWWDDGDVARDYFVAVDTQGRKLWVFRDRRSEGEWYLHGLYG
jgi:protein ImuB